MLKSRSIAPNDSLGSTFHLSRKPSVAQELPIYLTTNTTKRRLVRKIASNQSATSSSNQKQVSKKATHLNADLDFVR